MLGEKEGEEVEPAPSAVWQGESVKGNHGCKQGEYDIAESGEVSRPEDANAAGEDVSWYPRRNHTPPERFM